MNFVDNDKWGMGDPSLYQLLCSVLEMCEITEDSLYDPILV